MADEKSITAEEAGEGSDNQNVETEKEVESEATPNTKEEEVKETDEKKEDQAQKKVKAGTWNEKPYQYQF